MITTKRFGAWLAAFSLFAICVATLTPVYHGTPVGSPPLCVLCGERGLSDFLSNIILFAPLGIAVALRGGPFAYAAAIGLLLSGSIETLQLSAIAGRDTNLGDVVANTLGTVVGWALGHTRAWWLPRQSRATTRALTLTGLVVALLVAALSLLQPAPPETTYVLQWTPNLGLMPQYQGEVQRSALGGLEFEGPGRIQQTDSVRSLLHQPRWDVTFTAGRPPDLTAPIVSIYDQDQHEIMLLGATGADLVYRTHTRAASFRLDAPDRRIENALAGATPGMNVTLRYSADRAGYCVEFNGTQECGRGFTVGDTWALLMFPDGWSLTVRLAMSLFSLWLAFIPAGLLTTRPPLLAIVVAVTAIALAGLPPVIGFAATPWHQIAAACTGLVTGWWLMRRATRAGGHSMHADPRVYADPE